MVAARITLLIGLIAVLTRTGLAADEAWGRWQDDDGANIYDFGQNHQFRFLGLKKVWVQRQGFAPNLLSNLPRAREPQGQYMQERKEFSGAWETGENICAVSVAGRGKVSGNLKLYAGSVECCMEAKRLGPMLVLSAISSDNIPATDKAEEPAICANRALRQSTEEAK
jgi:hypothetical protein